MCDVAFIPMALTVAGSLFGADAANQEGKYQQQVQQNNAIVSDNMAKDAENRGKIEEANHRLKVAQMKSSQRARLGASGGDLNVGTAGELQMDTAMMGELDALTIRSNYQRDAYNYREQARGHTAQAGLERSKGKNTATATLLSGGTQVAGQWYNYTQR